MPHKKLQKIRIDNSLSQKQMAEKLCMSQSAYAKIESGNTQISLQMLLKIVELFKEEARDILCTETQAISIIVHETKDFAPYVSIKEILEDLDYKKDQIQSLKNTIVDLHANINLLCEMLESKKK